MITKLRNKFFEEIVFFISLILAVITGIFAKFHFEAIDVNVLGILTVLMLITLAFDKYGMLDAMAIKVLNRADSEKKTALSQIDRDSSHILVLVLHVECATLHLHTNYSLL